MATRVDAAWRRCLFCGAPIEGGEYPGGAVGLITTGLGLTLLPYCGDHFDDVFPLAQSMGAGGDFDVAYGWAMPELIEAAKLYDVPVWTYGKTA